MIIYKGINITDVAPVKISDIVVSGVKRAAVTRDRPIRPGAEFVRITDSTRQVNITLADLTNDEQTRLNEIDAINAWAAGDQPGKLVLPYRDGKYLMAVCTQYAEPSYRQWWENKLKLVFTCYEPYFNSPAENHVLIGTGATLNIAGSAEPLVYIEQLINGIPGGTTQATFVWSDGTNTLTVSGSIPTGGGLRVDLNNQTVMHSSGVSLSPLITLSSRFPEIKRKMTITGPGTVYWRERYV